MENNTTNDSSSGVLTGILIVVVILLVAWVAYANGFFNGKQVPADNAPAIHLDVTGNNGGGTNQ